MDHARLADGAAVHPAAEYAGATCDRHRPHEPCEGAHGRAAAHEHRSGTRIEAYHRLHSGAALHVNRLAPGEDERAGGELALQRWPGARDVAPKLVDEA